MGKADFPKTLTINDQQFTFRLMVAEDRNAVLSFAQHLPEEDVLFLRRDITRPEVVDEWVRDIISDRAITILAEKGNTLIGYGTLHYNQLFWNRHMGELRVMISSAHRNRGLGSRLAHEVMLFARRLGLAKVVAYMLAEEKSAQKVMEELTFKPEALLADWVKTRDDRTHDLLIMATAL
jgi:RimJ/RimL family protein N-acetyltransferase